MKLKVYLHYEDDAIDCYLTLPLSLEEKSIVSDILGEFSRAFTVKLGGPSAADLTLKNSDGKVLSPSVKLCDKVEHLDDLFVTINVNRKKEIANATAPAKEISKPSPMTKKPAAKKNDYSEYKTKVKKLMAAKFYRQARLLCNKILSTMPLEPSKQDGPIYTPFLESMAEIKMACKDYEAAAEFTQQALELNTKSKALIFLHAKALYLCRRHHESLEILRSSSSILHHAPSPNSSNTADIALYLDTQALTAECIFETGRHGDAANLVNACMAYPQAEKHISVLVAYSRFGWTYKKVEEPLRALLKAVTVDQSNQVVREMLAEILSADRDTGIQELFKQVGQSSAGAAPAYAFLATICKDYSALKAAATLLDTCMQLVPQAVSYALNATHVYEVMGRYDDAMRHLTDFCKLNPTLRIATSSSGIRFGTAELLAVLEQVDSLCCSIGTGTGTDESFYSAVRWIEDSTDSTVDAPSGSGSRGGAVRVRTVMSADPTTGVQCTDDGEGAEDWDQPCITMDPSQLVQYSAQDLDLLALGFTAVKILFVQGRIPALSALFCAIEPARLRSKVALHETDVRNEHAYYQSIAQILSYHQKSQEDAHSSGAATVSPYNPLQHDPLKSSITAAVEGRGKAVYVVGDSHCLPPAWSVVTFNGHRRLLIPKLATGVKQWHLRREGKFYPKANFENVVASIPSNATVIVMVGEIDCREGLLQAVERDYHESLAKAMETTATQFVKGLLQLAARKQWATVMVHPVVPVLDETRSTVMAFNQVYRNVIEKLSPPTPDKPTTLQWLDIVGQLVMPSGVDAGKEIAVTGAPFKLNPAFRMDGTHLHPSYVRIMQDAMERIVR